MCWGVELIDRPAAGDRGVLDETPAARLVDQLPRPGEHTHVVREHVDVLLDDDPRVGLEEVEVHARSTELVVDLPDGPLLDLDGHAVDDELVADLELTSHRHTGRVVLRLREEAVGGDDVASVGGVPPPFHRVTGEDVRGVTLSVRDREAELLLRRFQAVSSALLNGFASGSACRLGPRSPGSR
jgi:hypothetical protein